VIQAKLIFFFKKYLPPLQTDLSVNLIRFLDSQNVNKELSDLPVTKICQDRSKSNFFGSTCLYLKLGAEIKPSFWFK
jgi:hypothetical protein